MADNSSFDIGYYETDDLGKITNPAVGKILAFLTDAVGGSLWRYTSSGWEAIAGGGPPPAGLIYVAAGFYKGVPPASEILLITPVTEDVTILAGGTKCHGKALVAATAQTDFDLQKNGVSFGTMRFAAAGTVATFIVASNTSFTQASNDDFRVVAPASPDATLSTVHFAIWGQR